MIGVNRVRLLTTACVFGALLTLMSPARGEIVDIQVNGQFFQGFTVGGGGPLFFPLQNFTLTYEFDQSSVAPATPPSYALSSYAVYGAKTTVDLGSNHYVIPASGTGSPSTIDLVNWPQSRYSLPLTGPANAVQISAASTTNIFTGTSVGVGLYTFNSPSVPSPLTTSTFSASVSQSLDNAPCNYGTSTCFPPNYVSLNLPNQPITIQNRQYEDLLGYATSVTYSPAGQTPPPTNLDLAKMADSAYQVGQTGQVPAPIDGYSFVKSASGNGGFAAQVFRNGDQVVVAVRGTDLNSPYGKAKTTLADTTFSKGAVSLDFMNQVTNAANLVASLETDPAYAGASFTLTGHSLGGAVAQVIGNKTGLPTTVFDAPGAGSVLNDSAIVAALSPLTGISSPNIGAQTNIRMYGDQISFVGTAIGNQLTVNTTPAMKTVVDTNPLWTTFKASHDPDLLISQLQAGEQPYAGDGPRAKIEIDFGTKIANFIEFVRRPVYGFIDLLLDPPSGQYFLFSLDAGSAPLYDLTLPFQSGVLRYGIDEYLNGVWSADTFVDPAQPYFFDPNVSQFRFWALDANNLNISSENGLVFGLQFSQDGVFSGSLTIENAQSVTEPSSLVLIILALACFILTHIKKLTYSA